MKQKQELEYLSIEKLKLDLDNPRLPDKYRKSDENKVIDYMIFHGAINELMQSIAVNGFFAGEPLVVIPDGDNFIVVEGNRRLTALKLLNNPSLTDEKKTLYNELKELGADKDLQNIPCVKFGSRKETLQFLGFKHIVGVKDWSPLEKAQYISQLEGDIIDKSLSLNDKSKELAQIIGSKSDYIKRLIIGYRIFLIIKDKYKFFNIEELDETTFIFVNLTDSLNRKSLKEFFGVDYSLVDPLSNLNIKNIEHWTKWFFEEDINTGNTFFKGISSQITMLSKIIQNEDALKCLIEDKDVQKAKLLAEDTNEALDRYLSNITIYIEKAVKVAKKHDEKNGYIESVEKIKKSLKKLIKILSEK